MTKPKILIIEDGLHNQQAIVEELAGKGILIYQAFTQKQALELLQQHGNFDLVLLDGHVPPDTAELEQDTTALAKRMRDHPHFSGLLVAYSSDVHIVAELLEAGCDTAVSEKDKGPSAVCSMLGLEVKTPTNVS